MDEQQDQHCPDLDPRSGAHSVLQPVQRSELDSDQQPELRSELDSDPRSEAH